MATIFQEKANGFESRTAFDMFDGFRLVVKLEMTPPIHLLVANPRHHLRVNGQLVVGGIRVLDHKDEILHGANRYYFSSESKPELVIYRRQSESRPVRCPVCRGPVNNGDQVVFCPGCQRVYHQVDGSEEQSERPCWTYAASCQFCNHPTSLTGENGWRPEEENQ